jgi:hypothetical protein
MNKPFVISFSIILIVFLSFSNHSNASHTDISSNENLSSYIEGGNILSFNITRQKENFDVNGITPAIIIGDKEISNIWEKVPMFEIPSFGMNGTFKSVYTSDKVYLLLTSAIDLNWIALQWDSDNTGFQNIQPMENNDDMWIFGQGSYHGIIGDGFNNGIDPGIDLDVDSVINGGKANILYEKVIFNDSDGNSLFNQWEIERKLSTEDTNGHDVEFVLPFISKINYTVLFASNQFHKIDNLITRANFSFSTFHVSGGSTFFHIHPASFDVQKFMINSFAYGIFGGILFTIIFVYFPLSYYNKDKAKNSLITKNQEKLSSEDK